jgi:hypothetical protein
MDDGLNERDLRMVNEKREGVADHRRTAQIAVLLGRSAPRADTPAGRHHDGRYVCGHPIHPFVLHEP